MSTARTPNHDEGLSAQSSITGEQEYLQSTNGLLDINIAGDIIVGDINITEIGGASINLGQTTMSASLPVAIASDQTPLSITAVSLPLPSGASTSSNQTSGAQKTQIVGADNTTSIASGNSIGISTSKISLQSQFEATTGWSQSAGANNLATTTTHVGIGINFLTFDKIAGNTVAMISKTLTTFDASAYGLGANGFVWVYLPNITNVSSINVRFGTDSSNYCQWDFTTNLQVGWNFLQAPISVPTSQVGNGYDLAAMSYLAVGVTFGAASNTLTGIITGGAALQRTLSNAGVTNTTVVTGNTNVAQIGGTVVAVSAGNRTNGTQRVTLANNDVLVTDIENIFGTSSLVTTTQADGIVNTTDGLNTTTFTYGFNGSSFDRLRTSDAALNSTGTGLLTSQLAAQFDDSSPTAITENRFGNLRISANRNLYETLRDAAGNERGLNITSRNSALIEGPTASGSSIAASPVTVGGQAKTANPTAVTDGQVVNTTLDKLGKQVVVQSIRDLKGLQTTTITTSTSETTIVTAGGSGVFCDVNSIMITNISVTACNVTIKDATAGTTRAILAVPAGDTRSINVSDPWIQAASNNNWTATCSASVASIIVTVGYVKNL